MATRVSVFGETATMEEIRSWYAFRARYIGSRDADAEFSVDDIYLPVVHGAFVVAFLKARTWWLPEIRRCFEAGQSRARAAARAEERRREHQAWYSPLTRARLWVMLSEEQRHEFELANRVSEISRYTGIAWRFHPGTDDAVAILEDVPSPLPSRRVTMTICVLPDIHAQTRAAVDTITCFLTLLRSGEEFRLIKHGFDHGGAMTYEQRKMFMHWVDNNQKPLRIGEDLRPVPDRPQRYNFRITNEPF